VREAQISEVGRGTLGTGFFRMQVDTEGPADDTMDTPPAPRTLH
jgi:FKBP-type peptidyl-prolyl cis-trans isomerase SlyD